jgi:hypothetical protein
MAISFLTGGQQTTVNSTITELFPALCFNNGFNPRTPQELEKFINGVVLDSAKSKKTFVTPSNLKAGKDFIVLKDRIRPDMREEKIQNAYAITKFLFETHKNKSIDKVVWGYREKPTGVPSNHAGDIFIYFKDKTTYPAIAGISLKAGSEKSAEPKMNSYVKTTLIKPMWKKSAPNAVKELKKELWQKVYSKVPALPSSLNADNYFTEIGAKETVKANPIMVEKLINFFEADPKSFDDLYGVMNKVCREKLVEVINKDIKAAKEWIGTEFRLEKKGEDIPLVLVKAIRTNFEMAGDPLADMLPLAKTIKAYLNPNSVQEWFIDVSNGKKTLTLLMTIRSDSEFRRAKPKGKLGSFVGLKLLYRGIKK